MTSFLVESANISNETPLRAPYDGINLTYTTNPESTCNVSPEPEDNSEDASSGDDQQDDSMNATAGKEGCTFNTSIAKYCSLFLLFVASFFM